MKKKLLSVALASVMLFTAACGVKQEDYDKVVAEKDQLTTQLEVSKKETETVKADVDATKTEIEELKSNLSSLEEEKETLMLKYEEYEAYKEQMEPFEALSVAEAEAKTAVAKKEKAEAEKALADQKAAEKAEKERLAQEEKDRKAAEKAKGYETGITYSQLARTPDDYKNKKVKFSGKVIQVIEEYGYINIRLAVNSDYDQIILGEYYSDIVKSRVLEDDIITIYGTSDGLYTYQSTMGGKITIPSISIDRIDQ